MSEQSTAPAVTTEATQLPVNLAVLRCHRAYARAYAEVLREIQEEYRQQAAGDVEENEEEHEGEDTGPSDYRARLVAREAYRGALPPLSGSRNIRDFIACVADGLLAHIFADKESSRLLYAAQVAHGAHSKRRPRSTTQAA